MNPHSALTENDSGTVVSRLYIYFVDPSDLTKTRVVVECFDHYVRYNTLEVDDIVDAHVDHMQPLKMLDWVIDPELIRRSCLERVL